MATAPLTARQQEELHKAIHGYLVSSGFDEAAASFADKSGVTSDATTDDALLKKWKSIVRLQKKVLDLEAQVSELQEAAKNGGGLKKADESDSLPKSAPKFTLMGHRGAVSQCAFHPSFSYLATASDDASVKLWDYETGKFQRSLNGHTDAVSAVAFAPSGALLASAGADLNVKLWDMSSFECVKTLSGHDHTVSALAFAPASDALYTASRDGTIKAWDPATGYCARTLTGHDGWVRALALSPSGRILASGGQDQGVRLWDTTTGECLQTFTDHEHVVECVAFSNAKTDAAIRKAFNLTGAPASRAAALRERLAASRAAAAAASAAAAGTAAPIAASPAAAEGSSAQASVALLAAGSADGGGQFLFTGGRDRTVRVWDLTSLQCVSVITVCENWVNDVAVHPSGKYILAAADDKAVRVLDVTRQFREVKKLALPAFASSLSWNAAPPMLAVALADSTIRVFECGTGVM
jgi:platelet-activating factor acetylhydrolase IB subunit alpha